MIRTPDINPSIPKEQILRFLPHLPCFDFPALWGLRRRRRLCHRRRHHRRRRRRRRHHRRRRRHRHRSNNLRSSCNSPIMR